jgi:signal transduction histidine kinase
LTISTVINNNDSNLQPLPTDKIPFKKLEKILQIKFIDTGAGIEKDDIEKGTGLGLSISYSIIERHRGDS